MFTTSTRNRSYARWILYSTGAVIALGTCIVYGLGVLIPQAGRPKNGFSDWSREINWPEVPTDLVSPFTILEISSTRNGRLYAICASRNIDPTRSTLLHGVVSDDGRFWQTVTLQAALRFPKWSRQIGRSPNFEGEVETKVLVPGETAMVHVDLAPYRTLIWNYRYGSVVTESGAVDSFDLKLLSDTANDR